MRGALAKVRARRCERRGLAGGDQNHSMTEYHNYYKRYALAGMVRDAASYAYGHPSKVRSSTNDSRTENNA